jgi:hypothetical protein
MTKEKIEWVRPNTWYCNNCKIYLDDNIEKMEMHDCEVIKGTNEKLDYAN